MNSFDDDAQLDMLLDAADADLLRHARSTAEHGRLLMALLAAEAGPADQEEAVTGPTRESPNPPPGQGTSTAVIELRCLTDSILRAVNQTRTALRDFRDVLRGRDLDDALDRVRALASDLDHVLDLVHDSDLDFVHDSDPDNDSDSDLEYALEDALDRVHELVRNLDRVREPFRAREPFHIYEPFREPFRARARAVDGVLEGVLEPVLELNRGLRILEVDASGANLSGLDLGDLGALDGVIWTEQTRWPRERSEEIRARSRRIAEGVWQVTVGNERVDATVLNA